VTTTVDAMSTSSTSSAVADATAFLAANWSKDVDPQTWRELVIDERWSALRWPSAWFGRDLADDEAKEVEAVFAAAGAPGPGQDITNLWAGTMLAFGSDELKAQFMRPLLLDEVAMCLLYSEPGAGSDLAGIRTTAVRDGEESVVNGQKVWTSGARDADYGMLIARTDWDQPKHRGITFFWFPMRQPGVEVRPLRQATGDARFNEVFITDARVPETHRVGELNKGWWVLQTALAYERMAMGGVRRGGGGRAPSGATAAAHGTIPVPDVWLTKLARDMGRADDPVVRQRLMTLHCHRVVNDLNGERAKAVAKASRWPCCSTRRVACRATCWAWRPGWTAMRSRARETTTTRSSTPTSSPSAAVPTRSSATSSANGCSASRRSPRWTATCRSATWRRADR
jgi:alkylation response protein AidB-like acyl-CoA dehydrogenase